MSSIHELLKQVYPLKLRMELFNAIWTNWREDVKEKDQRIAELEEQLKNAPKYTVYSKVFFVDDCEKTIKEDFVEQITINHRDGILYELINNFLFEESELFATKEEAEAKLKELGEKK